MIKLALKAVGYPFDDEEIGAVTWDVWMDESSATGKPARNR